MEDSFFDYAIENGMEFPGVDLQIMDYFFVGDGAFYDQHFYLIQITTDKLKYTIDRSYVDFVILHNNLTKYYLGSDLPDLPLKGENIINNILSNLGSTAFDMRKQAKKLSNNNHSFNVSTGASIRESISASSSMVNKLRENFLSSSNGVNTVSSDGSDNTTNLFPIPRHSHENFRSLSQALTLYLSQLICHHELLVSNELLLFLDEEINNMFLPVTPPALSTYDIVLLNENFQHCVVNKNVEFSFEIPAKHLIIWKFTTLNYDIAFQVNINHRVKVPLTRYPSHERPICGGIYVESRAHCVLKFDNSYAKLFAKQLYLSTKIVSKYEYNSIKQQALVVQREKRRYEVQRHLLKLSTTRHASKLSGVIHDYNQHYYNMNNHHQNILIIENSEQIEEEYTQRVALENELARMTSDHVIAQQKLLNTIESRDELLQENQKLSKSMQLMEDSYKFTVSKIQEQENELNALNKQIADLLQENHLKEEDREHLEQVLDSDQSYLRELLATLNNLLTFMDANIDKMKDNKDIISEKLANKKNAFLKIIAALDKNSATSKKKGQKGSKSQASKSLSDIKEELLKLNLDETMMDVSTLVNDILKDFEYSSSIIDLYMQLFMTTRTMIQKLQPSEYLSRENTPKHATNATSDVLGDDRNGTNQYFDFDDDDDADLAINHIMNSHSSSNNALKYSSPSNHTASFGNLKETANNQLTPISLSSRSNVQWQEIEQIIIANSPLEHSNYIDNMLDPLNNNDD